MRCGRNSKDRGGRVYRPDLADDYARWRRGRSRRNRRFEAEDWALVLIGLKQQWSPEQISGVAAAKGEAVDKPTRRSIATSGRTGDEEESSIVTFADHRSRDVNATAAMTVGAGSRASG